MDKSFYTKEFILETFYWPNGTQNSGHCNKTWMINHGYYYDLLNYYDDSTGISETLYRILNNIDERQVFLTCCDPSQVMRMCKGKSFHIKNGAVFEDK